MTAIQDLKDFVEKKKAIPSPLWFHGIYTEVKELEEDIKWLLELRITPFLCTPEQTKLKELKEKYNG